MRTNTLKAIIKTSVVAGLVLLLGASVSFAQSVNLTAQPQHALQPDGRSVPMWGLVCTGASGASCSSLNYNGTAYAAQAGGDSWQPPLIIVPPGALTINLTNALSFSNGNTVPTSLVIVGQLGGGLGSGGTTDAPSAFPHPTQGTTWPIQGGTGPDDTVFTPPDQAGRVRSFGTEVLTTSGAVGLSWSNLKPGTYLLESGTHPSIQGPMGLYGVVVVTTAPSSGTGTAYPGVTYNADVPLLLSEIDATQNTSVDQAVNTSGFLETRKWNSLVGECGDPSVHTCYPPAVNYSPRYYMINGVSFDRNAANLTKSLFATNPSTGVTPVTGQVLVRIVNAGLSTHIPSIVGAQTGSPAVSGFSLIAEDGNVLPGNHRVQSEVLMVAGKTYDLMINAPASGAAALPIYDRQLSLSTNNQRDGGMQGYIGANGATLNTTGIGLTTVANPDVYYLVPGNTLTVSDPGAGVLANDVGVYGATVTGTVTGLTKFNADGTFAYSGAVPATFNYCANTGSPCTTVTINTCNSTTMVGGKACQGGSPLAASDAYSSTATKLHISPPGVLINDTDPDGHPLKAVFESANGVCASATLSDDGSFTATASASGNCVISYHDVNSQNVSSNSTTATIAFPAPSNITVNVQDALTHAPVTQYRWIIEEDQTFQINPATQVQTACTPVPPATTCADPNVPSLGTSFHTSNMPVVASGCVGDFACENGQSVLDGGTHIPAVCDIGNGICHAGTERDPMQPGQVALDPNRRYYLSVLPGDAANGFNSGAGGPVSTPEGGQAVTLNKARTSNTVTVTLPPADLPSGLQVGDIVDISGAANTRANGKHAVTSVTAGGYTYTLSGNNNFTLTADAATYDFSRPFSLARDCPTPDDYAPGTGTCGHTMGGTPIVPTCTAAGACTLPTSVTVNVEPTPLPTAQIAVYVFEDDWPLNGEVDAGGGVDTLATQETGLGGFEIVLFDQAGGFGDSTGQPTYDMFNMPLSNALAGTPDPMHPGNDACPITQKTDGLVGMIVTCPHFESDGVTPSPLEGQALISNLYPGLYEVFATPGADRIAKGEEWLQTNTLDGTKPHEAFIKAGEPAYFQEFGPAGYHVAIGFASPEVINARKASECAPPTVCSNSVHGTVTTTRISRQPDERLYSSGDYTANSFTQCYASLGDADGEDIAFTKCDDQGRYSFTGIPDGTWRITIFDQWNDLLVDGLSTPVALGAGASDVELDIPTQQWRTNLSTQTFIDSNNDGVFEEGEPGLSLVPVNIRFRDGSFAFFNNTDLAGAAGFNEIFPLFNWLVVEADSTRYKQTGVHVVYDAGGPADGTPGGGTSTIADHVANTIERNPVPSAPGDNLRVPGAVYCADADCSTSSIATGPIAGGSSGPGGSTGRIDPPSFTTEGFQGFIGQTQFLEFGKKPFNPGENGGIRGHVLYMSTRPFDDPALLLQLSWSPGVPNVRVNLYKEGTAPDGTKSLTLVDYTETTSWDKWAQGFRSDGIPNMNCPGQTASSPFFFTLNGSTQWLDQPLFNGGLPTTPLPNNAQFKCYDGLQSFNQVQPAPYDGMYSFPSVTSINPANGKPAGTHCTGCITNPSSSSPNDPTYDPYYAGQSMLPAGKYVVEVVVPPGYELVKEEDKNILIGDNYIAPVTQQFGGLGSIFIMPDQAAVAEATNPNNPLNQTTDLGASPRHEGDTGSVETFWPCVGESRVVPDYISLFPGSQEVSPFAGATRNLCDRKEVTLEDQMTVLAKFYVFSSTHLAAHYTGIITDDFASEFDPFSPSFGEKFALPNMPISVKDFNGVEISRTYTDQWGLFNGLNYSTWEVNPPNPTGYAPTMMVMCMNDPGPIPDPNNPTQMITDPLFNPGYSQFCYEWSFMPGQTAYLDTPVVPTSAFAEAYNPPDCAYPDTTPAVKEVDGDSTGPWVSATGSRHLTITALGDVNNILNPNYSGPQADTPPYNQKFITRHYDFGARPSTCPSTGVCPNVTVGGIPLINVDTWTTTTITGTVQNGGTSSTQMPLCTIQQRGPSSNGGARCGELVITAANGKKSVDTVTVTLGGKAPTLVAPGPDAIQNAIDAALPGDLLMVSPGTYDERLIMWKPVRLQGVAAASVVINANAHPSGKMDVWRRKVNCLFGIALNGAPINNTTTSATFNLYDPSGTYTCPFNGTAQVDAIPGEPIVGWDSNLNGNLAELLQEPTLMGAYEGAGITVLAKGLSNPNTPGVCDALDAGGCVLLSQNQCANGNNSLTSTNPNSRSNFWCNPSRIDGISFINSSAGGGGVFLHGFNHNMEVSNNRVYNNIGTLTGGITVGQVEVTDGTIAGTQELAFGYNRNVNLHNNNVTRNGAIGDEINSTTPASAGGVTLCTGADSYLFNNNWVCGNLSSGDGGGVSHFGFSYNGTISNNWILFNQSNNPTIPTNGGGLSIIGVPPDGPVCENATQDQDCPPDLSDGVGPGLKIDANFIIGNTAESGSGGGIRLQAVNGTDVQRNLRSPNNWYGVTITNNIIANNVAGWDGGGVSMQDALRVSFINNTVVNNDTTASAGVLFNTLGAANANTPPPGCTPQPDPTQPQNPNCINVVTTSTNQPAGLVTMRHTPNLRTAIGNGGLTCPSGNGSTTQCRQFSFPILRNNLFWQNRAFHIDVLGFGADLQNQQHDVALVPTLDQTATGQCFTGTNNFWDIGVRGDTGPTAHQSATFTLAPTNSIFSSGGYTGSGNINPSPATQNQTVQEYCNGSRVPPENGGHGYIVPPGITDGTVNPVLTVFNLTPAATVDEGNNWINMAYGPLTLFKPDATTVLGDYRICGGVGAPAASCTTTSPAINVASGTSAPDHDFFGTHRPQNGGFDIGAVEFVGTTSGGGTPTRPNPGLLDNFNRANANTLNNGANWSQNVTLGSAGIRVNSNQAFCIDTGLSALQCVGVAGNVGGTAYWNTPTSGFGASQAAAFTFASTAVNNVSLILESSGSSTLGIQANSVRVRYSTSGGGQVLVETTTNSGGTYTTQGTIPGTFANGDTMTVLVDSTGAVWVWKNASTTPLNSTGVSTGVTTGGRIGMQLPAGTRVDNFSGGAI